MSNSRYTIQPRDFEKINAQLLYICLSRFEGDWQSIPHTHHFTEIIFVLSGRGHFLIEQEKYAIAAGDLILIPPNMEHTELSLPTDPMEYYVLGIDGVTFQGDTAPDGYFICSCRRENGISGILSLLLEEAREEKEGCSLICQNLLEILLIQIARRQKLSPLPYTSTKMTRECGLIKRYLDSNYAENITLESLAALAHMNKYYLVHAFTKYTGLSPINYLNQKRIKAGGELLTGTNHSISQIASLAGFSSQSYFAQVFKKETGLSPVQYRKAHASTDVLFTK